MITSGGGLARELRSQCCDDAAIGGKLPRDGIEALCRFDPELCARLGH